MIYSENEDYAELRTKYIFDRNNINQFKERITDNLSRGQFDDILKDIDSKDSNIEHIILKCQRLLLESSDCCRKTYTTGLPRDKPWFDDICKYMKTQKKKTLRQFRRAKNCRKSEQI